MATQLNIPGEVKRMKEVDEQTEINLKQAKLRDALKRVGSGANIPQSSLNYYHTNPMPQSVPPVTTYNAMNYGSQGLINTPYTIGIDPYNQQVQPPLDTESWKWAYSTPTIMTDPMDAILDSMFTYDEKEEYLKSIGYDTPDNEDGLLKASRKDSDGNDCTVWENVYTVFKREMGIKFKNLLLSKASLKIKI